MYTSKTKSINALSSTEIELIAAVTVYKTARFLRSMIQEIGFIQDSPTTIYENNDNTIAIVNYSITTEITCHIYVWLFSVQGWK